MYRMYNNSSGQNTSLYFLVVSSKLLGERTQIKCSHWPNVLLLRFREKLSPQLIPTIQMCMTNQSWHLMLSLSNDVLSETAARSAIVSSFNLESWRFREDKWQSSFLSRLQSLSIAVARILFVKTLMLEWYNYVYIENLPHSRFTQ